MKESRLATWQKILIIVGALLILGPIVWDFLTDTFTALADVQLGDIVTRDGMFVIGLLLLVVVAAYEVYEDFHDKPKSKHVK